MPTITISTLKAIERLQQKHQTGTSLLTNFATADEINWDDNVTSYEDWHSSVARLLGQIFSDQTVSDEFKDDDFGQNEERRNNYDHKTLFKREFGGKIRKLSSIINDLQSGLYQEAKPNRDKWNEFLRTLIITIVGIVGGIIAGRVSNQDNSARSKQGLDKLSVEGKWKYICTGLGGRYQHGGRFTMLKDENGAYYLSGNRMWRDDFDSLNKKWVEKTYVPNEYLNWSSEWIFVKDKSKMYFEYVIPNQPLETRGFCSGDIDRVGDSVKSVTGSFYVLNNTPILTGKIYFERVTNSEFNSPSPLPKGR